MDYKAFAMTRLSAHRAPFADRLPDRDEPIQDRSQELRLNSDIAKFRLPEEAVSAPLGFCQQPYDSSALRRDQKLFGPRALEHFEMMREHMRRGKVVGIIGPHNPEIGKIWKPIESERQSLEIRERRRAG